MKAKWLIEGSDVWRRAASLVGGAVVTYTPTTTHECMTWCALYKQREFSGGKAFLQDKSGYSYPFDAGKPVRMVVTTAGHAYWKARDYWHNFPQFFDVDRVGSFAGMVQVGPRLVVVAMGGVAHTVACDSQGTIEVNPMSHAHGFDYEDDE